jgi:CHAT domain-containing protein
VSPNAETTFQRKQRIAGADAQLPDALQDVSNLVLKPLVPFATTQRLLVVADGALQYLPFGMLPMATPDGTSKPLIADFEVVTMPSASAIAIQRAQLNGRPRAPNGVAVIADPVFDTTDSRMMSRAAVVRSGAEDTTGSARILEHLQLPRKNASSTSSLTIPRLPYTRDEADAILAAAAGQNNLSAIGFDATKEKVVSDNLGSYRIVHFATHGFLDSERPSLSAVVLSLVDRTGKPQDGILRAHDLYNLNLPVDLVVLSSCQSGLGKDIRGEGLFGLTQGLMYAGAARVIVSLWSVSDKATAALMGHLYREMLGSGKSPAAALRAAQLATMRETGWENPYYWAAFSVQGDWQ